MGRRLVAVGLTLLLAGCLSATEMSEEDFVATMSRPRDMERFHYIGSQADHDYFAGEQWALHSHPHAARKTERFFKVKQSGMITERFPLTKETSRWTELRKKEPQPSSPGDK